MPKIQLLIEMDEQMQISVTGPLNNKVICYGMLQAAADIIKDAGDNAGKKIVPPTNGDVLSLNRR